MADIRSCFVSIGRIEELAGMDSWAHRYSPTAKVLVTLMFVVAVVSCDRYAVMRLIPFYLYPVAMMAMGRIPAGVIIRSVVIVSPFAVLVGVFNPIFDREIMYHIGSIGITGGMVSFFSILLRFSLTVSAVFVLISTTGFYGICAALERLRIPSPFVIQLMFLYRYIFVIAEEAENMSTARALRSFGRGSGLGSFVPLIGHLLLRSMERAQRIHLAMFSRGYRGEMTMSGSKSDGCDFCFVLGWGFILLGLRLLPSRGLL